MKRECILILILVLLPTAFNKLYSQRDGLLPIIDMDILNLKEYSTTKKNNIYEDGVMYHKITTLSMENNFHDMSEVESLVLKIKPMESFKLNVPLSNTQVYTFTGLNGKKLTVINISPVNIPGVSRDRTGGNAGTAVSLDLNQILVDLFNPKAKKLREQTCRAKILNTRFVYNMN